MNKTKDAHGTASGEEDARSTQSANRHESPNPLPATAQDRLLVAHLLAGDRRAFAQIIEQHHGSLVRLARSFVASQAVAEEVAQEAWEAVVRGLPSFEGRSSLKTWIFRVLVNRAITRGAREARSVPLSSVLGETAELDPAVNPERFRDDGRWADPPRLWESETPERILMRREALERLGQVLEELPPNQRVVLTLRDLEGQDSAEVCNILGITETNQRVLLHRARSRLREALEQYVDRS